VSSEPREILQYLRQLYQLNERLEQSLQQVKTIEDVLSIFSSQFYKNVDRLDEITFDLLKERATIDDIIRELNDYLVSRDDKFERIFLVILEYISKNGNVSEQVKRRTAELFGDVLQDHLTHLRFQLKTHMQNLDKARDTAARQGMNVSTEIQNEIEWETTKINEIREEMAVVDRQINEL
jgi:chromosome segregation ATPase